MPTEATPTETTTVTSNVPAWAQKYATDILGFGKALTYPKVNPVTGQLESGFQPYRGELVAQPSPLQSQAYSDLSKMQVAPQISQATGLTGLAALQAQDVGQYDPLRSRQYYRSAFDRPGGLDNYMSPYMQGVVEQQKGQAIADYGRQLPGMAAAAARAGAKGGTREALVRSEGQRNLFDQLGNIQATGLQNAYQQAQAQAAQDAAMRAQYGLAGAQLGEASKQFGANLGMQGIGQQLAAAGTLGGLGQQEYGQRMGINQAQLGAGTQIQSLGQQDLASRYQQFLNEQQLPFQQMGFFSDILRGTPSSAAIQQRYQAPPSLGGMIGGLGLAGLGSLYGGLGN
jgi:hypothetical protein